MPGSFKILGPFVKITKNADPALARKIALRSILFSIDALVSAAFLGESILSKYGMPVPILSLSGRISLFLVALLNIIHQFQPTEADDESVRLPPLSLALNPLTVPAIVTPNVIAGSKCKKL